MDTEVSRIPIKTQTITLTQFLKWAGVVATGGEAKALIQEGKITRNGVVETRRGARLSPGEIIEVKGRGCFQVGRSLSYPPEG